MRGRGHVKAIANAHCRERGEKCLVCVIVTTRIHSRIQNLWDVI